MSNLQSMFFELLSFFLNFSLLIKFVLFALKILHMSCNLLFFICDILLCSLENGPLYFDFIHLVHDVGSAICMMRSYRGCQLICCFLLRLLLLFFLIVARIFFLLVVILMFGTSLRLSICIILGLNFSIRFFNVVFLRHFVLNFGGTWTNDILLRLSKLTFIVYGNTILMLLGYYIFFVLVPCLESHALVRLIRFEHLFAVRFFFLRHFGLLWVPLFHCIVQLLGPDILQVDQMFPSLLVLGHLLGGSLAGEQVYLFVGS